MKEQGKTPEELSEGKTGNLPKKTVVKIMKEFWRKEWMHRVSSQKLWNKELENAKNNQIEKQNTIAEMKNIRRNQQYTKWYRGKDQ